MKAVSLHEQSPTDQSSHHPSTTSYLHQSQQQQSQHATTPHPSNNISGGGGQPAGQGQPSSTHSSSLSVFANASAHATTAAGLEAQPTSNSQQQGTSSTPTYALNDSHAPSSLPTTTLNHSQAPVTPTHAHNNSQPLTSINAAAPDNSSIVDVRALTGVSQEAPPQQEPSRQPSSGRPSAIKGTPSLWNMVFSGSSRCVCVVCCMRVSARACILCACVCVCVELHCEGTLCH